MSTSTPRQSDPIESMLLAGRPLAEAYAFAATRAETAGAPEPCGSSTAETVAPRAAA